MEEAAEVSDITWEEEPTVAIIKTMSSKAQLLKRDTEELLDLCSPTGPSKKSRRRQTALEGQANIEEDGETLIIDGFRFESAVSREDRRRLRPLPGRRGGGGGGGWRDGLSPGLTAQGQRGQGTSRRNNK